MDPDRPGSKYRVEKQRAEAVVTLSSGGVIRGYFFTAGGSARRAGPERVGDLLNADSGFVPFEIHDGEDVRTVMFNRSHIVMVTLADNEASRDSGYGVAAARQVSVLLSNAHRVVGAVRIYQPEGRDRLSDWARQPEMFRYVEAETTVLVNTAHVVEVREVVEP